VADLARDINHWVRMVNYQGSVCRINHLFLLTSSMWEMNISGGNDDTVNLEYFLNSGPQLVGCRMNN
jgi:hypothetical protein